MLARILKAQAARILSRGMIFSPPVKNPAPRLHVTAGDRVISLSRIAEKLWAFCRSI